jgi:predicted PurR-regulated permease PerM
MRFERDIIFWVAALAVVVALLWLFSPILLPFVLGMAIAYVLDPLANQLSKRGVGRFFWLQVSFWAALSLCLRFWCC